MGPFDIPYGGSFQRGKYIRKGNPDTDPWKYIQKIGTLDNLGRIAIKKQLDTKLSTITSISLRIRQSLELHEASMNCSELTRPLLLYYSSLNLIRAALLITKGDAGKPTHGLSFKANSDLLRCSASISTNGTFPKIIEASGNQHSSYLKKKEMTLSEMLAQIPEIYDEYSIIAKQEQIIASVNVDACFDRDIFLKYEIHTLSATDFEKRWRELLPWMSEYCEYAAPYTLRVLRRPNDHDDVSSFCHKHLWRDLMWRNDATWYDLLNKSEVNLLPRIASHIGALFILSNISRYEPELLIEVLKPTDIAFVITSFLDATERAIPLLAIEIFEGATYFG
ncbi:YaaC family protein [Ampullimonas aquatilis]|uniref:YaaC family protein n=1 Tax=Ampullimonas aquatilis TaxID=1341549 RepID=UPI003C710CF6